MKKDLVLKARAGDVESMFKLAGILYAGRGVEQNYELARSWYEAAAEAGHVAAKYELGQMLLAGLGGEQDITRAAELMADASEKGNAKAKFELGAMYASGRGVKKNYVKAMKLLRESQTPEAAAMLGDAASWWKAPAMLGIAEAEYNYGLCFANSYGLPQDYVTARYWLLKAALKGNAKAYDALSQVYANGFGVAASARNANYFRKCYCDIKDIPYEKYGITGDETISPDELNPDLITLPVYEGADENEDKAPEPIILNNSMPKQL